MRKMIATLVATLCLIAPSSALADPVLGLDSSHVPTGKPVPQGTYAKYTVAVSNTGSSTTSGAITVDFSVPAGLEITSVTDELGQEFEGLFGFPVPIWECSIVGDSQSVSCDGIDVAGNLGGPFTIPPGDEACVTNPELGLPCRIIVMVKAGPGAPTGTVHPTITACGGGATVCPAVGATAPGDPFEVVPFAFQLTGFDGRVLQENGDPATQAGSHPFTAGTEFSVNTYLHVQGRELPVEELKDASVEIPPGLVGNPRVYPTCSQVQLRPSPTQCPPESQIGTVTIDFVGFSPSTPTVGVYNMDVPHGLPALFGFGYLGNVTEIYAEVRTGEDYGVTLTAVNAPQTLAIEGVDFTFWGVPADPSHDAQRICAGSGFPGCAERGPLKPFVSLPTSCVGPGPNNSVETFLDVASWQGGTDSASFLSHDNTEPIPNPIGADGCNAVDFSPTLEARPTTNVADSPSGFDVDLHIPQEEDCDPGPPVSCEAAQAHLKDTTVTLPEGLVVNPSSANGLGGCSLAQFGYTSTGQDGTIHTTPDPATCPDASKLGTVQVDTPLLADPLKGAVYLANPYANPFNSLLALYIAVDDKRTDIVVKLAGEVSTNPTTGRISATFTQNPQVPFEDFKLHFFGGSGGSLRTPATCGQYTTTSSMTPWSAPESGPPDTPSDTWGITQAPGGGPCPTSAGALPNSPSFDAGTVTPIANAYSPFIVHLRRNDGSQNFSALNVTPPQGLIAKLAGTTQCSEAALAAAAVKSGAQEKQSPSCPASSQVGSVVAGAGAGPAPYYAQGKAYLTGPYKGAPLSLAIITPASAGPFDLGTIVVRTAVYVDPRTAKINAVSDPIPTILQGIPLDVRTVDVSLDRPDFTFNPTSCDPMAVDGSLTSTLGQIAPLSSRFQVGECGRLGFKPRMSLRLKGGTTRGKHPALTAVLEPRAGDANIAALSVALPKSEFLDQSHIGTVCTRVQFAQDVCPAASIYGTATVFTPVLDEPLTGHVYLRSSDNLLPDLVPDLRGPAHLPIRVESAGRTDSINGGLRNTFDFVPDAPFTKLVVQLEGGRKGLLQNSRNICSQVYRATVKYTAHNGKTLTQRPPLKNSKCGKAKKRKAAKGAKRRARGGAQRAFR
jgi:hypothetical protein